MKSALPGIALACLLACSAQAQTLYAVSVRTYAEPGYKGVESNLYTVNPNTGVTSLVSPLTLDGSLPIGVDGLAIHPDNGTFYGITASTSSTLPRSLVSIEPRTGRVTAIGALGANGTDIDFDHDGTLYIWLPDTRQLGTVNLQTGAVTARGVAMRQGATKGALAIVGKGKALLATTGGHGRIDSVDMATGVIERGPDLEGAPFPDIISGLAWSPKGVLYAINTNFGTPALADFVSIDPATGKVTLIGPLPNDTDAISFGPSLEAGKSLAVNLNEWRLPILIALAFVAVAIIVLVMKPWKT
jgi:hypothetical protein